MYNNYIRLNLQLRLGERNKNYWVREKYDSTIEKRQTVKSNVTNVTF